MSALVIILLGTVLIQSSSIAADNTHPLPARMSLSDEIRGAAFTLISITLSALMGFAVTHYALNAWQFDYLRTPVIVLLTVAIILCTRAIVGHKNDEHPAPVLTLLTNQCALLGVALFASFYSQTLLGALASGFAVAVALVVLSAAFKGLMERVDRNLVPFVFRGIPIALITAGFMALALMGFVGIFKN